MQREQHTMYPAKRAFDVVVSLFLLVVLSPLIFLFFGAIFIEHCIRLHPFDALLYKDMRYSQGKLFMLYKFNIFKQDIVLGMRARDVFVDTKKLERTGELIFVGKILKQIYLDELPQLLNVLMGDMSLVGPRPLNPQVHKKFLSWGFDDCDKVRAGMTGIFQATHKGRGPSKTTQDCNREYAEFYFSNPWYKVLLFDLKIILRTMKVLLMARGI